MSFPVGEQFFIDAVRGGFKALPPRSKNGSRPKFKDSWVRRRRIAGSHSLYNAHLEKRGLVNAWEPRARGRLEQMQGVDLRHWLGITAANEHFTAILADWMLRNPELFGERDLRLKTLWLWHSAEESEHKSTAFDLYKALGGNEQWRIDLVPPDLDDCS